MKVVEDNVNLEELKQDSFSESGKTFGDKNQISILGVYDKYRTIYIMFVNVLNVKKIQNFIKEVYL